MQLKSRNLSSGACLGELHDVRPRGYRNEATVHADNRKSQLNIDRQPYAIRRWLSCQKAGSCCQRGSTIGLSRTNVSIPVCTGGIVMSHFCVLSSNGPFRWSPEKCILHHSETFGVLLTDPPTIRFRCDAGGWISLTILRTFVKRSCQVWLNATQQLWHLRCIFLLLLN